MYEEDSKEYELTRTTPGTISIFDQHEELGVKYYPTDWIKQCCANKSPVSLMSYTSKDWDDIISIKILGSNGKFELGNCITREELRMCIESEEDNDQPSYIQCIYSIPFDKRGSNLKTGLTASPTARLVFKLPVHNMFVTIGSLKRVMNCTKIRTWYAVPLFGGKRRRIGNILGMYGISMNHGQIPGYQVYKLFTKYEILSQTTITESYDDYILFLEQEMLLPLLYGHTGIGDVRGFIKNLIDAIVPPNIYAVFQKYSVNYTDPNNFIYKMGRMRIDSVKNEDGSFDLEAVYSLYMQCFFVEEINCSNKGITSFPVYPNLKKLICTYNKLKRIPPLGSLQKLFCYNSEVEEIGVCPELRILEAQNNKLTRLECYPKLQKLMCSHNNLETLPQMQNLRLLFCEQNQIQKLPIFPVLEMLTCHHNALKDLPLYPKLTLLDCSSNQIEALEMMNSLVTLECQNNSLESLPIFPNLKKLDCRFNLLKRIPHFPKLECVSYDKDKIHVLDLAPLPDCYL